MDQSSARLKPKRYQYEILICGFVFVPVPLPRTLTSPPCVEMRLLADYRFVRHNYNKDRILWGFSHLMKARYHRF